MATMLGLILCDASLDAATAQKALTAAVADSSTALASTGASTRTTRSCCWPMAVLLPYLAPSYCLEMMIRVLGAGRGR